MIIGTHYYYISYGYDYNTSFGYKSPVKKIAKMCAYTNKPFTKNKPATYEHIRPHCKGGPTRDNNMLAVLGEKNQERGALPFDVFLKENPEVPNNIQKYLDDLRGTIINGMDYVKEVCITLNREAKGLFTFKGRVKKGRESVNR